MSKSGYRLGPRAASDWLYVYPPGIRGILNWISRRYGNPIIHVTENGVDVPNENEMPLQQALNDTFRVDYLRDYLHQLYLTVTEDRVNVGGYFVWSLMDNFGMFIVILFLVYRMG